MKRESKREEGKQASEKEGKSKGRKVGRLRTDMSWFGTDVEALSAASECVWAVIGRKGLQPVDTLWGAEWTFLHRDKS